MWHVFHHPSISWELWKKKFILSTKRKIDFFKQMNPEALSHDNLFFLNTEPAFWDTKLFIYPLLSFLLFFFFLTVSGLKPCGLLAPQLGIKPASLAFQGRFLTTAPSGRSPPSFVFTNKRDWGRQRAWRCMNPVLACSILWPQERKWEKMKRFCPLSQCYLSGKV